jgi:hypothetical protein
LKIPSLDTFSPRLKTLRSKRADIHIEIQNKRTECAVIRARMQKTPDPGNEHDVRLRKILGEEPVTVRLPDADRLKELLTELDALNAAMGTVDAAILNETRIAGNKLLEAVKPEVTRLGSNFAKAFLALHEAHLQFDQYVSSLEDAGGNVSTLRIRPNGLSHPTDRSSAYFYGVREFIDAKFLSKNDMPKVLIQ